MGERNQDNVPESRAGGRALLISAVAFSLGIASSLGGCASGNYSEHATRYPEGQVQSRTVDIQVVRRSKRVTMTNTTATDFGPSRLWLNRRFSRPIEGWKIGETLDIPLVEFVDEFGEGFRPGGFFAAENPDKIVQAQLETPRIDDPDFVRTDEGGARMIGLVVVTASD